MKMARSGQRCVRARAHACVCECVCVCALKAAQNANPAFQYVFNRREICLEPSDTPLFVSKVARGIIFFFSLYGAKLFCRSWNRAASPPRHCRVAPYRYTPSLFLLSRFSSPPLPPVTQPPRRYMDTHLNWDIVIPRIRSSSILQTRLNASCNFYSRRHLYSSSGSQMPGAPG